MCLKHAVVPGLVEVAEVFENVSWNFGSHWSTMNTNSYSKRFRFIEGSLNSKLPTIWRVEKQIDEVKSEESKVRR